MIRINKPIIWTKRLCCNNPIYESVSPQVPDTNLKADPCSFPKHWMIWIVLRVQDQVKRNMLLLPIERLVIGIIESKGQDWCWTILN